MDEREALEALYTATGGANWGNKTNWSADISATACLGTLAGVDTDANGRVSEIVLRDNNLTGSLPGKLGDLTALTTLALSGNTLSGALPTQLGNLINLQSLELRNNQLSGALPTQLGNLSKLTHLNLHSNQLNGTLPTWLGNLSNLTHIHLHTNQLSGPIPTQLGNLSNLKRLYFHDNQLSGTIPPELGNLSNLEYLWLSNNQLSGAIPPELGNLTKLNWLYLDDNQLSGPIPSALGKLTKLLLLYFHYNQLSGPIPSALEDLTVLEELSFHGNQFSGSLPTQLSTLPKLKATYFSVDYNASSFCLPTTIQAWYNSKGFWTASLCGTTAPGSVTVTVPDNARAGLQVSWTAPTNTAFTTEGYHIDYSTDGRTWRSSRRKLVVGATTTSTHLTGLTDGQSYYVRVRATNQTGDITAFVPSLGSMWAAPSSPQSPHPAFGGRRLSNQVFTTGRAVRLVLPAATNLSTPTYTLTLDLPAGLSFDATTRTLSGTPTTVQPATTYTYTATDGTNADAGTLVFTIAITLPSPTTPGTGAGRGGGGGTDTTTDQHGDTPATASFPRLGGTMRGYIQSPADVDYFRVSVPANGILSVRTTGATNTTGQLEQDGQVLTTDDNSGAGNNFQLDAPVTPGTYYIAVRGLTSGAYTLAVRLVQGRLETPAAGRTSAQSGLTVLRGWVCEAELVEVEIEREDGLTSLTPVAHGTTRADTASTCGGVGNTGFGWLFNWNLVGEGTHTVRALADGIMFGEASVTVTMPDPSDEYLTDVSGQTVVADFPAAGQQVRLVWSQGLQNFSLTSPGAVLPPRPPVVSTPWGYLDNPAGASFQSGLGVISGWVCEAEAVVLEVTTEAGETYALETAYGTARADAAKRCEGKEEIGFGLLFNWNLLGAGVHTLRAVADGEEFGRAAVRVTTLGSEYPTGLQGQAEVADFPTAGQTTTLEWQEAAQNFVITGVE